MGLLISLAVSAFSGWLAANLLHMDSDNLLQNVILGILGGMVLGIVGFRASNIIAQIVLNAIGACIVVYVYNNYIKK